MAANPLVDTPLVRMAAAAAVCCSVLWLFAGPANRGAVVLGMLGPLVAAVATWIAVERMHARAPEQVSGLMIKLFGAKLVLFAGYVAGVVLLLAAGNVAFVVSFTCHYILLHAMEAVYLRRLFAGDGRHWGIG